MLALTNKEIVAYISSKMANENVVLHINYLVLTRPHTPLPTEALRLRRIAA